MTTRGWLHKRGGQENKKGWKRRWCVLHNRAFHYYKSDSDREAAGTIYAEDIMRVVASKDEAKDYPFPFEVETPERVYLFSAKAKEEREEWIKKISEVAISRARTLTKGVSEVLQYTTIESFSEKGIRVNGDVGSVVLSCLSQGVGPKQKKQDERGWFCDAHVPAASILELMSKHGWSLTNAFHTKSTNVQGTTLMPATMFIFSRPSA
eukprot:m.309178 g.309178  ORF g.309178 m.309178 type:complete len:208 (+) comp45728_c0_seq1:177-800(+)